MRFIKSAIVIGAIIGAVGGGVAGAAIMQGPGTGTGTGGGPVYAQGSFLNICVSQSDESHQYVEENSTETGNCAAGYTQYTVPVDPDHIALGSEASTTSDSVTVNNPGTLDFTLGDASQTYQLSAASNKGYAITDWYMSGNPASDGTACFVIQQTSTSSEPGGLVSLSAATSTSATDCEGTWPVTVEAVDAEGVAGYVSFNVVISAP